MSKSGSSAGGASGASRTARNKRVADGGRTDRQHKSPSQHAELRRNAERASAGGNPKQTAKSKKEKTLGKIADKLAKARERNAKQASAKRSKIAKAREKAKKTARKAANKKRAKLFSDVSKSAKKQGMHNEARNLANAAKRLRNKG